MHTYGRYIDLQNRLGPVQAYKYHDPHRHFPSLRSFIACFTSRHLLEYSFYPTKFPTIQKRRQKTVGLNFLQCPRSRVSLLLFPTHCEVGGDPLEMGTLRPWENTKTGVSHDPMPPLMQSFPRPMGIAWP